jgi:hypothetical protein
MIEDYYKRLSAINSNPEKIQTLSEDAKIRLKNALEEIKSKIEGTDEEIQAAITNFMTTFQELDLETVLKEDVKSRSLSPKVETTLPREILNDVTILTLKML